MLCIYLCGDWLEIFEGWFGRVGTVNLESMNEGFRKVGRLEGKSNSRRNIQDSEKL